MTYRTTFRVEVRDTKDAVYAHCSAKVARTAHNGSEWTTNECTAGRNQFTYCARCDAGAICNHSRPYVPFEAQANLKALVDAFELQILSYLGILVLAVVLLVALLWFMYGHYKADNLHKVINLRFSLSLARWMLIMFGSLTMLAAGAVIVSGLVVYGSASPIGKLGVMAAILVAAVLCLVAYLGTVAAFFRNKVQLAVNGIVLAVIAVALIMASLCLGYAAQLVYSGSPTVIDFLTTQWERQAQSNPKRLCTVQDTFGCSGLLISCQNQSHSQCPDLCDITNLRYPKPCLAVATETLREYSYLTLVLPSGMTLVMAFILGLNWALCCCIHRRRGQVLARLTALPGGDAAHNALLCVRVLRNLTREELDRLSDRFQTLDQSGDGTMDARELREFYYETLKVKLTDMDVADVLRRFGALAIRRRRRRGSVVAEEYDHLLDFHEFLVICQIGQLTWFQE
uniref:EF-hand domain-containing protein n=1 Tax=Eutreptiella gymnastica TaxID=73025 RepID=A0A7S1NDK0_9EUGL|mmetsp:Transcript_21818/g.39219  ORF Transcript_21818/g.39219 Transcript_21818/m.39219 type:complete len:456 (+) Transcript_21818:2-1369(+)